MPQIKERSAVQPGDLVEVIGHRIGEPSRLGEILEVLGAPNHLHFRVRWDDDHESIFYPGNDAIIRQGHRRRKPAR